MIFTPHRRPCVVPEATIELIAERTGRTLEHDPATGRMTLKTDLGVYVSYPGGEVTE